MDEIESWIRMRRKVGRGLIDCFALEDLEGVEVVTADVSGRVYAIDSSGAIVWQFSFETPAWGCSMIKTGADRFVSVALADKQNSGGRAVLLRNDEIVVDLDTQSPCWDTAIFGDRVYWTAWSGHIFIYDLKSESVEKLYVGGQLYGLSVHDNSLFVVAHGGGVYELAYERQHAIEVVRAPSACYNIALSPYGIICGSDSGMLIGTDAAIKQLRTSGRGSYSAVGTFSNLIAVGNLNGDFEIFHRSIPRPLARTRFSGSVWHIECMNPSLGIYIACGNGELIHIELPDYLDDVSNGAATAPPLPLAGGSAKPKSPRLEVGTIVSQITEDWEGLTATEATKCLELFKQLADDGDDTDDYLLCRGLLLAKTGDYDNAIINFQAIENPSIRTEAAPVLSIAFEAMGSISSSIRALQDVIDDLPDVQAKSVLFRIGSLHVRRGDYERALRIFESLSFIDHSYPGLVDVLGTCREALENAEGAGPVQIELANTPSLPLRPPRIIEPTPAPARRRDAYGLIHYVMYEYGSAADEAKKTLEMVEMTDVVKSLTVKQLSKTALDVGCATGRWPLWIARHDYEAHGYDISKDAIDICTRTAEDYPTLDLRFRLHDLSAGALESNYFSLVTCMMGTFNHIPSNVRPSFLTNVLETMLVGGKFIFTIWNTESPFCDFLTLDSQQSKDTLRANGSTVEDLRAELTAAGFAINRITPMCFLPNRCYDVWDDDQVDIVALDKSIREDVKASRAQMYFFECEHSVHT